MTGPIPAGDLPALAAYAVDHDLEAEAATVEWRFITEAERGKYRMIADAAITGLLVILTRTPDTGLRGGHPVTFNDEPELTGHVSIRFPAEMIPMIKRLAAAKGMTVSAWIRHEVDREAARRGQSAPDAGVPSEALDIAWNALQHIALHGDDKSAAKSRETLRAVNEYLEDGTTEDGIDRTPRAAPAPEATEMRAVIDMIWRMCQQPGGERLAERIAGLIKNSGMEPF